MNGLNKHIRLRLLDKEHVYKRFWGLKTINVTQRKKIEKKKLKTVQNYSKEIKIQLLFISTIYGDGLFQNKAISEA